MSEHLDNIYAVAVPLPIPEIARQTAEQFAAVQFSASKARQVRHNTLAVWVMNDYCQMLGISTDLERSDSWNPTVQLMADVADLVIRGVGRIECRPILAAATECLVPPETWTLRVGYGVIELSEDFKTARLLGFTPTVTDEILALTTLSSPEDLIDHLHTLSLFQTVADDVRQPIARLSQWFDSIVDAGWLDAGWQTIDTLLSTTNLTPDFSVRSHLLGQLDRDVETGIRKGKIINLSVRLGSEQVLLLVHLQSQTIDEIHIGLKVYPVGQSYLPSNLDLRILEATGEVFMQAQSRLADNYIQLQFNGKPGEPFTVQVKLEDIYHSEQFVV